MIYQNTFYKKFQIPLRRPQRPQPVFDPNRVCVHFTFCCHQCTHFDWPIHTYVEACGSNTLLRSVVQPYSHNVIKSVYTCMAFCCYQCTHFAWSSLLYNLTMPTYTHGAHTVLGLVVLLYSHNVIQSVYTCTAFCCYQCKHFAWPILLCNLTLPTHTCGAHTCGAHTMLGSFVPLYIHTGVQSLYVCSVNLF